MDSEGSTGSVRNGMVKKETTNLVEEVMLLMMGCSSGDEHKQVEKPTRRLSVINQSSSMERSSRCADSIESLAKSVEISNSPKRVLKISVEHVERSVEHEASLVSSVGSSNCFIKSVEQMECPDHLGEQVNISKSLAGNLGSLDSSTWSVDSLDLEQEVLSLQEKLHAEKDLRVVLEVQDEKWRL